MAASNYEASLARVLTHEGGYSNHPSDPGGATNFGITIANYARFKARTVTAAEVKAMPLADAKAIYRGSYWNVLRCDELPAGLDYAVFDYGVNSGPGRAAKVLQRLLGFAANGTITDAVIAGAGERKPADLVVAICDERLVFLKSLKTWPVFGTGWGRRVSEVRRDALAMTKGELVAPSVSAAASGKGSVPAPASARAATTAAAAAASAGAAQLSYNMGASTSIVLTIIAIGARPCRCRLDRLDGLAQAQAGCARNHIGTNAMTGLRQKLKGWRTVIFGGAITVAGVALDLLNALQLVDLTPLLPPQHALKIMTIIGIVTILLRAMTTGRIGQRDC